MAQLRRSASANPLPRVTELYPSAHATGRESPKPGGEPMTSDGAEANAVLCRQCNFPIKDGQKQSDCPSCGSDNFWGDTFPSTR